MKQNLPVNAQNEIQPSDSDDESDDFIRRRNSMKSVYQTPTRTGQQTSSNEELLEIEFFAMAKTFENSIGVVEITLADGFMEIGRLTLEDCQNDWQLFKTKYNELSVALGGNVDDCFQEFSRLRQKYMHLWSQTSEKTTEIKRIKTESMPLKLDNIKIPIFYGTYETWPTFSSLFGTLVLNNDAYNELQRMQLLKSLVKGDAGRAINNLAVEEGNFDKAWKILNDRFNNRKAIVDKHLKNLIKMDVLS